MSRTGRIGSTAAALLLAATAVVGCAPAEQTITIAIHYSAFDPPVLTVPRGVPVTFVLVNRDPIDHEWLIGDQAFHEAHRDGTHPGHAGVPTEVSLPALETVETTIVFGDPGTLLYICHLPAHESYGMVGELIVDG
ncbi:MAG: cupredoxin domain-containing protein [Chloroflexota bacterium]|nr:cupredoxin domain-containing protein [Chloroflexota bacterium]